MTEPIQTAETPKKKAARIKIEDILSPTLLELVRIAPRNEVVRTQVHEETKRAIPDEHITSESIIGWVEDTYDPKFNFDINQSVACLAYPDFRETGTAKYTMSKRVSWAIELSVVELVILFRKCNKQGMRWDKFTRMVGDRVYEHLQKKIKEIEAEGKLDEFTEKHLYSKDFTGVEERRDVVIDTSTVGRGAVSDRHIADNVYSMLEKVIPNELLSMTARG